MSRKMFVVTVAGLCCLPAAILAAPALRKFRVVVPEYHNPGKLVSWNRAGPDEQRFRFHHTAQGTRLLPYGGSWRWSSPAFLFSAVILLSETTYLGTIRIFGKQA